MTLRKNAPRAKRRWMTLGFAVAAMMLLVASAVLGAATDPLAGSTFEGGDGNLLTNVSGHTDWDTAPAPVSVGIDKPSGRTDNAFGQGTKEDNANVTIVTGSIPPNKNDLTRFYVASETVAGQTFLYLAWERAVNIGNANMDFEINQNATTGFDANTTGAITLNRTAGDLLVTYDFGGSGTPTLGIRTWTGSAWGPSTTLNATNSQGAVNTVAVNDPISGVNNLGIGLFGEAAINLTGANIIPAGTCESFGSAFLKSRSSSSFPAELKDFIAPVSVHISNCGSITIRKVTVPAGDTTTLFGYTRTGTGYTSGFNLTGGSANTVASLQAGSYSVTETDPSGVGYTFTSIDCSATTGAGTSATPSGSTVNITLTAGGNVDCTYTNTKNLANPDATTAPTLVPQDSATVNNFDASGDGTGHLTFNLWDDNTCAGTLLYTEDAGAVVTGSEAFATTNSGDPLDNGGYTISGDETDFWQVVYAGDDRNNGFTSDCTAESVAVDITP
jgi:hypothetical protein